MVWLDLTYIVNPTGASVRLEFWEDGSSIGSCAGEDEFATLECSAEAKRQAIEGDKEEEENEVDEKTPVDHKREYDDVIEVVFL